SRPPYLDGYRLESRKNDDPETCAERAARIKQVGREVERSADFVICNPLSAHLLERPIILWLEIGIPCRSALSAPAAPPRDPAGPIRIVHAPSDPVSKGTPAIRRAVENLRARCPYPLEYVELQGRPNREVLEELARCDLVVDQVYNDTAMAGLATEAAAFGKPAVVGGYGWPQL